MNLPIRLPGGGKNIKLLYFAGAYMRRLHPGVWLRHRRRHILERLRLRPDFDAVKRRIDYYCDCGRRPLEPGAPAISGVKMRCTKVYRLDSEEIRRYFPPQLRWRFVAGDNVRAFEEPTIVKSRPIGARGDVLLKLNRVRHYIFRRDGLSWESKLPRAVFRGKIGGKPGRIDFMWRYFGHPLVDAGCIDSPEGLPGEWVTPKMSIYDHFRYRYILCLEGNDVASNLKWVMHSNSVAVMPRPRFETWYMEGLLKPGVHYVEVADDLSDLPQKIAWCEAHPEEVRRIVRNAQEWTRQFLDRRLERAIGVAVMHNYLVRTGQLLEPEI